jgi:hypothetical protein
LFWPEKEARILRCFPHFRNCYLTAVIWPSD